jgi:hypothetical protein
MRAGARVGMVSLSAEEDRANLKHKAALRTQLEATILHLLRVAVAESEPEPEPQPDGPSRQIDKDSPSVRDHVPFACSLWSTVSRAQC